MFAGLLHAYLSKKVAHFSINGGSQHGFDIFVMVDDQLLAAGGGGGGGGGICWPCHPTRGPPRTSLSPLEAMAGQHETRRCLTRMPSTALVAMGRSMPSESLRSRCVSCMSFGAP